MNKIEQLYQLIKDIAHLTFKRDYAQIKKMGLHPGQQLFLKIIHEKEGLHLHTIAAISQREPATVTKAVQRLEALDLIKREEDPVDRRSYRLFTTHKGKEIYQNFQTLEENQKKELVKILSYQEIDNLYSILHKIREELERGVK